MNSDGFEFLEQVARGVSLFDFWSPWAGILAENREGPCTGFYIPANIGYSTRFVREVLESRGVRIVGPIDLQPEWMRFSVPARHGRWACKLLEREGIPYSAGGTLAE